MTATIPNYRVYDVGDERLAVRDTGDERAELFRRTGESRNVRTIAAADAVLYDDDVLDVVVYEGRVIFQEPWAGERVRYAPKEWVDDPIVTFERVNPTMDEHKADTEEP